jgi:hypothetical protein
MMRAADLAIAWPPLGRLRQFGTVDLESAYCDDSNVWPGIIVQQQCSLWQQSRRLAVNSLLQSGLWALMTVGIDRCNARSEIHQKSSVHVPKDGPNYLSRACRSTLLILLTCRHCNGTATSHLQWWLCLKCPHPLPRSAEEVSAMSPCVLSCGHPPSA